MIQKSYEKSEKGKIYLVPTPIGNLDDITLRAINTFKSVSLVVAEDTRVTRELLSHLNIKKEIKSCYKYNELGNIDYIIKKLEEGLDVAYASDRGTPLISDPGYILVKKLLELKYDVISLPGATAFVPALTSSGIISNHFLFYGFLNSKETYAMKELEEIKKMNYTSILYESPHRLKKTLGYILEVFGNINISISREITKLYEEVFRGNINDAINYYENPKGEFVIILEQVEQTGEINYEKMYEEIKSFIKRGLSTKEAVKEVAIKYDISKNMLYNKYEQEGKK